MAPLTADIEPLGVKHKNYNNKIKNALTNSTKLDSKEFTMEIDDLDNLMKIDIASNMKDLEYILSVLKSKDMLCVSRALQQCPWLVDDQYKQVINPQYLRENLLPKMTTKAGIKLMKHIRQFLKDEKRIQEFYKSEGDSKYAIKWLTRCSDEFIEKEIKEKKPYLNAEQFKRLCEKSPKLFEAMAECMGDYNSKEFFTVAQCLLKTHSSMYLDLLEKKLPAYVRFMFNDKATKIIMTKQYERIMKKPAYYLMQVHVPTFVKYLKPNEIKSFLYKMANNNDFYNHYRSYLFKFDTIKYFIKRLPKDEQFDFVKNFFIDKSLKDISEEKANAEEEAPRRICEALLKHDPTPKHLWYNFAPFDIAFAEIKNLIAAAESSEAKSKILIDLIPMAQRKNENLRHIFKFYNKSSLKDDKSTKLKFIKVVFKNSDIHKYDDETWNEFNAILSGISDEDNYHYRDKSVIIYNVTHKKPVPENIMQNFAFDTMAEDSKHMTSEESELIFNFLFNFLKNKIENLNITDEKTFKEAVTLVGNLLDLLKDWKKSFPDFPFALENIRHLIKVKKENSWKVDLAHLYSKNKSWRIHMFEESVALCPSQDVCVNALKHDPSLLTRNENEVKTLCTNDKLFLKQLHKKLRVYWSSSLAEHWSQNYFEKLETLEGHEAVMRNILTLLPQGKLWEIINKYAPKNPKIDWSETNGILLSIQRCIAKYMHIARPQPIPDAVLLYAKGDYLQYALPSVLAIYYNLSRSSSQEHVIKLLDTPVSLQKHGLRFAFQKLDHNLLKQHLSNIWNNTKNATIKIVIFEHTFERLTKEQDDAKAADLWELMDVFIDNLTYKENKKIYDLLTNVNKIENMSVKVRPMFLVKSYKFTKNLFEHTKDGQYKYSLDSLAAATRNVIEYIPAEFFEELLTKFLNESFFNSSGHNISYQYGIIPVISAYFLSAKDEEIQLQRYEKTFVPLLKRCMDNWDQSRDGNYYVRCNFQEILNCFKADLKEYVIAKDLLVPSKLYANILNDLIHLSVPENYYTLTMWKLVVKMTELIQKYKSNQWEEVCSKISPELGEIMVIYLKEDVKRYFSNVYLLYCKVLADLIDPIPFNSQLKIYQTILKDCEFIEGYLCVIKMYNKYMENDETKPIGRELLKTIREHPSVQVKMHYYSNFEESEWE